MAKTASAKATKPTTKVSKSSKASKKAEPVKQKIEESSSSSSSDSSDSESEVEEKKTKKVTKKVSKKVAKKEESSSESSSSSSESEKEEAKADSSSESEAEDKKSDSDSSSESEDEKVEAKKDDSDSSDSESEDEKEASKSDSSDSSSDEEMADATTNGKRKADTEAEKPAKVAKVESDEIFTVWVGGLDFNATNEDVKQLFAECGTVIDARIVNDRNTGRSKGYGYVDFADSESKDKAKEYHETEFMGRQLRVDDAPTRGSQPRDSGNQRSKPLSQKSDTVFVGNISFECDDNALREAFEGFGNVIGVRLPTDRETGNLKGYGYVQFDSEDAAEKAVNEMNGFELLGRGLRTDFGGARPAGNEGGRGGFGGGRGGFGGRGGGRGGRGGFGGDRGGRGGFGGRGGGRGGRGGFGGNRGGFSSGPSGNHVKF